MQEHKQANTDRKVYLCNKNLMVLLGAFQIYLLIHSNTYHCKKCWQIILKAHLKTIQTMFCIRSRESHRAHFCSIPAYYIYKQVSALALQGLSTVTIFEKIVGRLSQLQSRIKDLTRIIRIPVKSSLICPETAASRKTSEYFSINFYLNDKCFAWNNCLHSSLIKSIL